MTELPESVIEDLRRARVPWVEGMAGGDRRGQFFRVALLHPNGGALVVTGSATLPVSAAGLAAMAPDPRDRATFLLLCDEAERRGVEALTFDDGCHMYMLDGSARAWGAWDPRDTETIAALVRALAETAPEVGRG